MAWVLALMVLLLAGRLYVEYRDHTYLKVKTEILMRRSLELASEVVMLRIKVGMYVDRELEEGPEVYIPDVIGDPDGTVDLRA